RRRDAEEADRIADERRAALAAECERLTNDLKRMRGELDAARLELEQQRDRLAHPSERARETQKLLDAVRKDNARLQREKDMLRRRLAGGEPITPDAAVAAAAAAADQASVQ